MEEGEVEAQKSESLRRRSCDSNHSPEFEFWNIARNPSFPQPNQLSADQLFSHGVLLPLDLLQCPLDDHDKTQPEPELSAPITNSSKRWTDIFKKTEKKDSPGSNGEKEEKKKREKKHIGGSSGAELNINIWPFSRSRSAGNRPRVTGGSSSATRKVSSAPCSRSNSAGESKSRKWPTSPSRGGVHLGRSSPVWQVRRSVASGSGSDKLAKTADKAVRKQVPNNSTVKKEGRRDVSSAGGGGHKARALKLNVPMCIGYRNQLGCRSDENSATSVAASDGGTVAGEGARGGNLFNIRSLFTKKVY